MTHKSKIAGRPAEIELRHLRYFIAVANALSFRGAADQIGVRQPNVSQRIAEFEDLLGVSLFERRAGRGVRLTRAGNRLLPDARRVVQEVARAQDVATRAGRAEIGDFVFGFSLPLNQAPLGTALSQFHESAPEVEITFVEGNSVELAAQVLDRRIDIAIVIGDTAHLSVKSLPLWSAQLYVALPAAHPLRDRAVIDWGCLAEFPMSVRCWESASTTYDYVAQRIHSDAHREHIDQHRVSRESLMAIAASGFGPAITFGLPAHQVHAQLVMRSIDETDAVRPVSAIWLDELQNPAVGRFVSMLRDAAARSGGTY